MEKLVGLRKVLKGITSIEQTGLFTAEDGRNYYKNTTFMYRGTKYSIDFAENPIIKKTIFGVTADLPVRVADKGQRPFYIFAKEGSGRESHTLVASRELANYVFLAENGIKHYLSGNYQVNHMRAYVQPLDEYLELCDVFEKYIAYKKLEDTPSETQESLDFISLCESATTGIYAAVRESTNNFRHYPERLRDNSIYNLELATGADNRMHYQVVKNLTLYDKFGANFLTKRVPVYWARLYKQDPNNQFVISKLKELK